MKPVTIYSTPTCHYCRLAKQFFADHGVAYTEHDVAADSARASEMMEKSGQMGVPVIDVDGEIVIGFDQPRLAELLEIKA